MNFFLTMAFLFFIGSVFGWGLEVFFRRFFPSANPQRKWINPGFLVGPYLPLYGFCLCALYNLATLESYFRISNPLLSKLVLFAVMALCVTALEYLFGLLSLKVAKIKLWDYSGQWGNIQGIVCPKFSLAWAILSALYYFFIHPHILTALQWLSENLAFSFCIGLFFGVFAIDLAYSAKIMVKIHNYADEKNFVVKYEELKAHIRASKEKGREKARFALAMHSRTPFGEHLRDYYEEQREKLAEIAEKLPLKKQRTR